MYIANINIKTNNVWNWFDKESNSRINTYNKQIETEYLVDMKYKLCDYVCDIIESLQCVITNDFNTSYAITNGITDCLCTLLQGIKHVQNNAKIIYTFNSVESYCQIKVVICNEVRI